MVRLYWPCERSWSILPQSFLNSGMAAILIQFMNRYSVMLYHMVDSFVIL